MRRMFGIMLAMGVFATVATMGEQVKDVEHTKGPAKIQHMKAQQEKGRQMKLEKEKQQAKDEAAKPVSKAEAYEQHAKHYEQRAEKAAEKGEAELAAILRECAHAKRKISTAMVAEDKALLEEGSKEYQAARKVLQEKLPPREKPIKDAARETGKVKPEKPAK